MKIREIGWFLDLFLHKNIVGICLAPFGIYVRNLNHLDTIHHEKIHWQQQMEMLIILFYLWYVIEWFIKIFIYSKKAYINISFERAAYAGDKGWYTWIKYL